MTLPQDVIGVDVSKDWIDCHRLSTGAAWRVEAKPRSLRRFASEAGDALVVFEASGGYERALAEALDAAGIAWARVNPRQVREFARASGRLAKTDQIDAAVLSAFGRALAPAPARPRDAAVERLAELVSRREALVGMRTAEMQRLGRTRDAFLRRQIAAVLRMLVCQIERLEVEIAAHLEGCPPLAARAAQLRTVPGIGPVLAAGLTARLPELGSLGRRAIASLAGLAPHACDSGTLRGRRHTWGGRAEVRRMLYLAALTGSRCDPRLGAIRAGFETAGKPAKVAITATARRMLTIINAMLRDGTEYASRPV